MASNLNKAFMRAYAKDRTASAEEATAASTPVAVPAPVAMPAASTVGLPAASAKPVAHPTSVPAPAAATTTSPVANAATIPSSSRIQPVVQPSMEPTVFAGRYAQPGVSAAQPKTAVNQINKPVAPSPNAAPAPISHSSESVAQPAVRNTHRIPSPSIQGSAPQPGRPQNSNPTIAPRTPAVQISNPTNNVPANNVPANLAQPRTISGNPARPVAPAGTAQPLPTRIEKVQEAHGGEASRVWQRIDAAHGAQATHPTETQARPMAAVSAASSVAPKRMQAAAAPAPAPVAAPAFHVDTPSSTNTRQLPLVGDDANVPAEPQQAETRRRTVADFLYSAGQYNPGRVLASAEHVDMAMQSPAATTAMPVAPMRTSEMVRPLDRTSERNVDSSMIGQPVINSLQSSEPLVAPSQPFASPDAQESVPRRMGQILRVDVPRKGSDMPTMPAAMPAEALPVAAVPINAVPTAMPAVAPAPMPTSMPVHAATATSMPSQSMPQSITQSMQSAAATATSIDAPVAKYVLEQRRIDRAHKLSEAEEKLRHITHKVFNPVWEVDNLQWPVVVDKLMQQRAQSMSHVAEHLKTACQDGLSVLGVTSADQGEGRTTVACCLARLAAAHGLKVALVDIDLDHPTLCIQTNMEVENDWRDCLSMDVSLEEVAVHSIDDQLTMMPLKPRGGRPGLLASDSRIADILNDLSECFELVIVDCAKINSSGNIITGLAHTKIFDAAIVVVDRRNGQADRVEDAVRMIQQTGIESIGIVDNFSM